MNTNYDSNETLDYEEFERDWKRRHKASLPRKVSVSSFATWFWIAFWVLVAVGAAIFSGAHTIPAAELTLFADMPYRNILAVTAFIMVDLVIFGSAAKRRQHWFMKWLLAFSIIVALIGNTSSSVRAVNENGGDVLNQIAGVLLSVIAPFTALAAGEVSHLQLAELAQKQREANEDYQRQWKDVDVKINTAFTKALNELKAKIEPVNPVKSVNFTALQREKPSPKMQMAMDWIQAHPEHLETESRELANLIGVSHTLANEARKHVKFSSNGHAE